MINFVDTQLSYIFDIPINDVKVYENRTFVSLYSANTWTAVLICEKNHEFPHAESTAKINGVYKYINFRPGHLATAGPGSAFHTWLVHTHRSFPKPWFVPTQLLPALIKTTQISGFNVRPIQ